MTATPADDALSGRLRARLAASPMTVDLLLALGLTALSLVTLWGGAQDLGLVDPLSLVLLLLQTLPLALRRVWPMSVFVLTTGATIAHASLATQGINSTLGFLIALFTVAERYEPRRSAIAAIVGAVAIGGLIAWKASLPASLSGLVQTELAVFVAWVLGTWARDRQAHIGTVEERARRLEREREERAERAVAEERERIARELHDVVTHHVSVIVIQAGAALRALDRRPTDARTAMEAIDATGRQALADMRRMLGILGRSGASGDGSGGVARTASPDDTLAPMPSLDRLGELLEKVRAAGMPVELSITGERRPLDPGIELSAYRIIQEALTNALKHAPGARARVGVRFEPAALEVRVVDEGGSGEPGLGTPGESGHGLIGMRERVALFGGQLEAGPAGRGFRVVARLPLGGLPLGGAGR
ncbi:MAG TPA: histidine kinase [Candidatus Limnocylindrales bacterium]|nr:histidine kinase [Candidatus Limnocylindrales bacterium]